jgi:hypothetical protein
MIALWASYELWLASPSYDAPSVQLKERGNHIITSAKHSYNSKLITKKSKIKLAYKHPEILGNRGFSGVSTLIVTGTMQYIPQRAASAALILYSNFLQLVRKIGNGISKNKGV